MPRSTVVLVLAGVLALSGACAKKKKAPAAPRPDPWAMELQVLFGREPDSTPTRWKNLINEYGADTVKRWYVIERDKRLWVVDHYQYSSPLEEKSDSLFVAPFLPVPVSGEVRFHMDSTGRAASIEAGGVVMPRRYEIPAAGTQLRITPVRPIEDLRREALAMKPPVETGTFTVADLVELAPLDSTIQFDLRYATENNFLGVKLYESGRAFLQRPAAAAFARANKNLRRLGYTLLVHDAYRPWYVTRIFWDATPPDKQWMVANPAQGSRHNRGVAVDVTLWDIERKIPVEMPSTYDESTPRAHTMFPGGTSLQRHYRLLLRRVLEHEGFAVHPLEWWHFDYVDKKLRYAIGNVGFDEIIVPTAPAVKP
jgi:D-alanyl-D-alanine dipeptidase